MSWWRDIYPRSSPREAKGGIKAQSRGGAFGKSWWAQRWIAVLESFNIGGRLSRGRSYARRGQVLSIDVGKGTVAAKVQGSRPTPYKVTIQVQSLTVTSWKKLAGVLGREALFAAKLLAGEMPQDIEKAFVDAQLSLFPTKLRDLKTDCSCPDYSNPCKHIAAVYYLLGEEFNRDPFLLFRLRGLERDELVGLLSAEKIPTASAADEPEPTPQSEPLPTDPQRFWQGQALPDDFLGAVQPPPVHAAVLGRLGKFPFWRGNENFADTLRPIYVSASNKGMEVLIGKEMAY